MNLKRGILIALALYAVTFILGIIIAIINIANSPATMSTSYWVITIVMTIILTSLASLWYFSKAKRNTLEGLKLGLTFVITGFVIDLILFFTQENGSQLIKEYYANTSFYIMLILVVATCIFVGSRVHHKVSEVEIKTKKKKRK